MSNLDEYGWLYFPDYCIFPDSFCNLSVVLHGCNMRAIDMLQKEHGWTSIAKENDIVLLFP